MTYLIATVLAALLTGWLCGVPYCLPLAVLIAAIAAAWERAE